MSLKDSSSEKFDHSHAMEYEVQSRIALAGYDACHELSACMLTAKLGRVPNANILVVGAGGTAEEVYRIATLEPEWRFTAVDPSAAMLECAKTRLAERDLSEKVRIIHGYVHDLPNDRCFDAATLIGVLHHIKAGEDKLDLLKAIAERLRPNSPMILACNYLRYESEPLFLSAWQQRWKMAGISSDEASRKLGKILEGARPVESEEEVDSLLAQAGFKRTKRFFSSLFLGGLDCILISCFYNYYVEDNRTAD
ncbi:MAG: class I SAM-dependent methyltransferase [Granulicella sp.]